MKFKAKRFSRGANLYLKGHIDQTFPLFGPIEEKKWADGWDPEVLYQESDEIEEGMVFRVKSDNQYEKHFHWIISKYQPQNHLVEYTVSTENRIWTIQLQLKTHHETNTVVTVNYTYTGLNKLGNELCEKAINNMYAKDLKDWEDAINHYLKHGQMLKTIK